MSFSMELRTTLRGLAALGLLGLFACAEPTAPPAGSDLVRANASEAGGRRLGGGKTGTDAFVPPTTETTGTTTSSGWVLPSTTLKFASWTSPSTRDTSFAVVVGKASTHQIMYKGTLLPFLRLEIPANARFFDTAGRELKQGSVVAVTVLVDAVYTAVRFGPHGTAFDRAPARICLNYYGFEPVAAPSGTMAIWYQPDATATWAAQSTTVDADFYWLCASLSHFSNYAVAY